MMDADFPLLYSKLGVQPGCSLDEFKRAYRRRVADLHPDRRREPADGGVQQELAQLIRLYKQALRFHAAHGRLPGGATPPDRPRIAAADAAHGDAPRDTAGASQATQRIADAPVAQERARTRWLLAGLAVLAVGLAWNAWESATPPPASGEARTDPEAPAARDAARPDHLVVGMSADDVLALQGAPTVQGGSVWEYGPSWIRFDKEGYVVEWYSSPLYRLKVRP